MKKRWTLITAVALVFSLYIGSVPAVADQGAGGGIQWVSYEEGRQRGETENKKVFLVFNADWCRYCLQMEKETFQDPTVIAYVNRNFVPISVNSDRQQEIAAKYSVRGLPNTFFISEAGDPIANRPGYIAPDEMLKILKFIGSDSYQSMSFSAFMKKGK
ncbi:thioredoxin [Desulfosarcina alkanivorans]|uniref:Thioredoxin n=1 Tax=Desulfosarcina alkanivorans TaxID=571177 RepID=A0A5K7YUJ3_9BACT|nr:thioredoxin fold domain-containing protein [Desulfosarcina alkanivorans]BBO71689.1 thioredoxin [Desulfosarcina alkanivorans]